MKSILKLANEFQTSAISKLASQFETLVSSNIHEEFRAELQEYLKEYKAIKKPLSLQDINNWIETNRSTLDQILSLQWAYYSMKDGLYSEWNIDNKYPNCAFMSMNNNPGKMNVSEHAILRANGVIPKMHLFIGKVYSGFEKLDKFLAQDDFIVITIDKFFNTTPELTSDIISLCNGFIKANKEKINSVRRFFQMQPYYLGAGATGVAFQISKDHVLKIFRDKHGYLKAKEAQERLYKNPTLGKTEAMIYDVGKFNEYVDPINGLHIELYYYITQLMQPLTSLSDDIHTGIENIIGKIKSIIEEDQKYKYILSLKFEGDEKKIFDFIKTESKNISKNLRKSINLDKLESELKEKVDIQNNWLDTFVEEILVKVITSRTDLHIGNLGITNYGLLRYFDPAWEGAQNKINLGREGHEDI
jgi:hypothetical protein